MQALGIRLNLAACAVQCWDIFKPSAVGTVSQSECQPRKVLRGKLTFCLQISPITSVIRRKTIMLYLSPILRQVVDIKKDELGKFSEC